MKTSQKWGIALSAILFLCITSCVEKSKEDKKNPEQESPEITKAPKGIISLKEAKSLCTNYEERRLGGIKEFERTQNPEKEFIPTQFIDFDFETIRKYVKYVEREAKRAKVKPDSLRIYLGNYGKDGKDPNRNTVFVLPTTTINGNHGGFFIDVKGNAKLIRDSWPKNENNGQKGDSKSKASFFPSLSTMLYQEQSLILNDGHSGPPPNTDFN